MVRLNQTGKVTEGETKLTRTSGLNVRPQTPHGTGRNREGSGMLKSGKNIMTLTAGYYGLASMTLLSQPLPFARG